MKDKFFAFYRPTPDEFKKMWESCLFVLDTSVLLHLYRYSAETRKELLDILEQVSSRLWAPHQVFLEFHWSRPAVIMDQLSVYGTIKGLLNHHEKELAKELREKVEQPHPFIDLDSLMKEVNRQFDKTREVLTATKAKHPDLLSDDEILSSISGLFEGKVGEPYSEEKLESICKEGERRYELKIPPGFADTGKPGNQKYGDLILWFQTIDKAKDAQKPIVMVTNERKEDWWFKSHNRILGPAPQMVEEMKAEADVGFYLYTADRFMKWAEEYLKSEVSEEAVKEVLDVWKLEERLRLAAQQVTSFSEMIDRVRAQIGADLAAAAKKMELAGMSAKAIEDVLEKSASYRHLPWQAYGLPIQKPEAVDESHPEEESPNAESGDKTGENAEESDPDIH